jgi:uncharacterized protein YcbK (DUF882 family)
LHSTVAQGSRTYAIRNKVWCKPFSQHTYGKAVDIQISGISPKKVAAYAENLLPRSGGIGIYKTFTHIDVRATKSRWHG